MGGRVHTVSGVVEFVWETDRELLVNLEPDHPGAPHTFEIAGTLREQLEGSLGEGDRVEVDFVPVVHEIVDPDSGPSDGERAEVRDIRVLRRR